jgi:hypothetical protein
VTNHYSGGSRWPTIEKDLVVFNLRDHLNKRKGHPCPECGTILFVRVQDLSFYCEVTESTVVIDSLTHVSCPRCPYADTY